MWQKLVSFVVDADTEINEEGCIFHTYIISTNIVSYFKIRISQCVGLLYVVYMNTLSMQYIFILGYLRAYSKNILAVLTPQIEPGSNFD